MALYINDSSITTMATFITSLNTFLTTGGAGNPGWNADRLVTGSGEWAVSKNDATTGEDVEVAFQWDTGAPNALGIYQYHSGLGAGNYVSGSFPYGQVGDSGNGAASTTDGTIQTARHAIITNTPLQYWAFTGDTWAYVVVQTSSTDYVHFGFGVLDRFNDWDGGAFAYGQRNQSVTATDPAVSEGATVLLDGLLRDGSSPLPTSGQELHAATVRCASLPGQVASGLWSVVMGNQTTLGNDRQAVPKARGLFIGGYRGGQLARETGVLLPSPSTGFVPGYPIQTMYWDKTNDEIYGPMGIMPGIRGISMQEFSAGDTFTIGSDSWMVFPSRKKDAGTSSSGTGNQGIMYLMST